MTASAEQCFFFNEYHEEVPLLSRTFVRGRGKYSAWTPTAKNGAAVPHRLSLPAKTIGQKPGGKAAPTFNGKENQMGRNQTERLTIRLTPEEKTAMQKRMHKAVVPSMRDFVLKMCMDGKSW